MNIEHMTAAQRYVLFVHCVMYVTCVLHVCRAGQLVMSVYLTIRMLFIFMMYSLGYTFKFSSTYVTLDTRYILRFHRAGY